jgi:signal transduction histidine kinase
MVVLYGGHWSIVWSIPFIQFIVYFFCFVYFVFFSLFFSCWFAAIFVLMLALILALVYFTCLLSILTLSVCGFVSVYVFACIVYMFNGIFLYCILLLVMKIQFVDICNPSVACTKCICFILRRLFLLYIDHCVRRASSFMSKT